jgi:hypothetical protein
VKEGKRLEEVIHQALPGAGELTKAIGEASPWSLPSQDATTTRKGKQKPVKPPRFTMHSKHKLIAFYAGVGSILVVLAVAAHVSANSGVPAKTNVTTTTSTAFS